MSIKACLGIKTFHSTTDTGYLDMPLIKEYLSLPRIIEYIDMPQIIEYLGMPSTTEHLGMPPINHSYSNVADNLRRPLTAYPQWWPQLSWYGIVDSKRPVHSTIAKVIRVNGKQQMAQEGRLGKLNVTISMMINNGIYDGR